MLFAASGCVAPECGIKKGDPKYVVVEARVGGTTGLPPQVEVTPTPAHERVRARINTIALRMPESCLNESAAAATGMGSTAKSIMGTTCGVWLAELERALINAGYRVISWNALLMAERQSRVSTYDAAKELGAQVVFILNSLEVNRMQAGASAQASYKYFAADAQGTKVGPQPLPQDDRNAIRSIVEPRLAGPADPSRVAALGATLDTTAILVDSRESIWFYRHSLTKPLRQAAGRKFLLASHGPGQWTLARPPLPQAQRSTNDLSAEDRETSSAAAGVEDVYAAESLELVRTVVRDCVARFQKGGAQ